MDPAKLAYFTQKFSLYDADALAELNRRRSDLADEAVAALDQFLAQKGLAGENLTQVADHQPPDVDGLTLEDQTHQSRALFRGALSSCCKVTIALAFVAPVTNLARSGSIGQAWAVVGTLAAFYLGWKAGVDATKRICANAEIGIKVKRARLWALLAAALAAFVVVYMLTNLMFARFGR